MYPNIYFIYLCILFIQIFYISDTYNYKYNYVLILEFIVVNYTINLLK